MSKIISCITALLLTVTAIGGTTVLAKGGDMPELAASGTLSVDSGWVLKGGAEIAEDGRIHLPKGSESRAYIDCASPEGTHYYNITANIYAGSCEGIAYLFAESDIGPDYISKTSVMKSSNINSYKTVTVNSPQSGKKLRIGVYSDGTKEIYADSFSYKDTQKPREFLQGGDITMIRYVLSYGGNYKDENGNLLYDSGDDIEVKIQKVINYLASRGMNFCRIRLTNNPGQPNSTKQYCLPEGYQDEADCLALAEYARNAGMKIQFTFNLSDYWSNAGRQIIPVDWQEKISGMTDKNQIVNTLAGCVSDYVTDIMEKLKTKDIYPEYVSIGNETTGGLLFPYGYSYDVASGDKSGEDALDMPVGSKNWAAIAKFINAGYDAVKAVSPDSQVVVHLDDKTGDYARDVKSSPTANWLGIGWWLRDLKSNGGKWDVTGISYYPRWSSQTIDTCVEYADYLKKQYGKPVLLMESGYEFNSTKKSGGYGQLHESSPVYKGLFSSTKEGQKGFVSELLAKMKATDSVIGSLYWDPMMIHVQNASGTNLTGWAHFYRTNKPDSNVVENTTLFDFNGAALPALEAYECNVFSEPIDDGIYIYAGYNEDKTLADVQFYNNDYEFDPSSMEGLDIHAYHWEGWATMRPADE